MPKGPRDVYLKVIQAVKQRDALYNSAHPSYRDINMIRSLWQEIGEVTGLRAPEAKRLWNTLRSSYSRSLNRGKAPGSKWYLADQMDFLHPYIHKWKDTEEEASEVGTEPDTEGDDSLLDPSSIKLEHAADSPGTLEMTPLSLRSASEADAPASHLINPDSLSQPHLVFPHSLSNLTLQNPKRPNMDQRLDAIYNNPTTNKKPRIDSVINGAPSDQSLSGSRRSRRWNAHSSTSSQHGQDEDYIRAQIYDRTVTDGGHSRSWLDTEDADWAFFRGILPMVRSLNARTKRRVQRDILRVIHAAVDEEEERAGSSALTETNSLNA